MKNLICGDIHATLNSLVEVRRLFQLMADTCQEHKIEDIILLGDQTDSFGVQSLPVLHMYKEMFQKYDYLNFIVLIGNHDYQINGNRHQHSMFPFKAHANVHVVDDFKNFDGFDVISFCRTEEEFLKLCENRKSKILFCHQEFNGCQYENGFYSKNGFDLEKVPYETVISGHIHKEQSFGKLWYPGAPRWLTKADANEKKGIYIWDEVTGDHIAIPTESVCRPIYSVEINETSQMPVLNDKADWILKVTGNKRFIQKMHDRYVGQADIKTFLIDTKHVTVKESMGINQALEHFVLNQYVSQYGIEKEILLKEIFSRLI